MSDRAVAMQVRGWVLDRSGFAILLVLFGVAIGLKQVLRNGWASGITFALFVSWLLAVFLELRKFGRPWTLWPLWAVPFLALYFHALIVVPLGGERFATDAAKWSAAVAAVSWLAIWDSVAISLSRRAARATDYLVTLLTALMGPLSILWVQHHLHRLSRVGNPTH